MKFKLKIKNPILIFLLILIVGACNEDNTPKDVYLEPAGSWQVIKASRNGTDITSLMDFDQFKLNLNEDGSYSIEHYLPFVTKKTNGRWKIDDPVFPFRLFFYDPDNSNEIIAQLNYPITQGKRQIILTFSPGCSNNIYSYTFERVITN